MSCLWRVYAKSLNLVSEDASIEGLTVPLGLAQHDILSSTVELQVDAVENRPIEAMDIYDFHWNLHSNQ